MNMLAVAVAAAATLLLVPTIDFVQHPHSTLPQPDARSADFIVGDGDFNQVRPEHPTDPATERINHTLRLQYIEQLLRSRDVSDMPEELRAERMRNLDRLHNYWVRAEYPVNYDHPTAWEPCFIDRDGAVCAVGYLVEQSVGRDVAEKINARYHFATVKKIDAPELAGWIEHSGLTKAEVVTIQGPGMWPDDRRFNRKELQVAIDTASLRAMRTGPVALSNVALSNVAPVAPAVRDSSSNAVQSAMSRALQPAVAPATPARENTPAGIQ
jgi:hypothetical protein